MHWRLTLRSTTPRHIRRLGRGIGTSSRVPLGTLRNSYARTTPTTTKNSLTRVVHTAPRAHLSNARNQQSQTSSVVRRGRRVPSTWSVWERRVVAERGCFRVRRHPSRDDAKRGDRFLQVVESKAREYAALVHSPCHLALPIQ